MALNCSKVWKSFRWIGLHAVLESFLNSTSSLQDAQPCSNRPVRRRRNPWSKYWCQIFEFFCSVSFSINWIVMSQQSDHQFPYLQTNVIKCLGSTSIHFRSRYGIDTRDNVEFDVCRGLAFATSFPLPFSPILSTWVSSDVSVTYLLIPITILIQKQVLSPKKDSIMISTP